MADIFSFKKLTDAEFKQHQTALLPLRIPIEQTPLWREFDNAISERTPLGNFAYFEDQRLVALASATLYRQRGRDWIWIKHGPLFASVPNSQIIKKMCATLKQQFSRTPTGTPLFIRLSMPAKIPALQTPFEHTMYDQTVVMDLTKPEDQLFMEMSQSARQSIRKATSLGTTTTEIGAETRTQVFKKELYPILAETGQRSGFGVHPAKLYTTMLDSLGPSVRLYAAYNEQSAAEAWAIITEYDKQALYYYGASSEAARISQSPYLLQWEIIKALKHRGNLIYDLMGIAGQHYPALANVTRFKLKFSKDIKQLPLTYDLPLQPIKYQALATVLKLKRHLKT